MDVAYADSDPRIRYLAKHYGDILSIIARKANIDIDLENSIPQIFKKSRHTTSAILQYQKSRQAAAARAEAEQKNNHNSNGKQQITDRDKKVKSTRFQVDGNDNDQEEDDENQITRNAEADDDNDNDDEDETDLAGNDRRMSRNRNGSRKLLRCVAFSHFFHFPL